MPDAATGMGRFAPPVRLSSSSVLDVIVGERIRVKDSQLTTFNGSERFDEPTYLSRA